jgi:protein TonB
MPERGFLDEKRQSPTGLIVVIAAHAAAITALALAKMESPPFFNPGPLTVRNIPITPDPPPMPPEPIKTESAQPKSIITAPVPIVPPRPSPSNPVAAEQPAEPTFSVTANGTDDLVKVQPLPPPPPQPLPPMAEPVRTQAKLKAGIELLPPYPPSEERAEAEGTVIVRLLIGPDGRVKSVEKISAASEAFWRATERHALRAWRFNPATVDGRPVESRQTMTVKFELRG